MDMDRIEEMVASYYYRNFGKYGEPTLEAFEELVAENAALKANNDVLYRLNSDLTIKNAELAQEVASLNSICAICRAAGRPD